MALLLSLYLYLDAAIATRCQLPKSSPQPTANSPARLEASDDASLTDVRRVAQQSVGSAGGRM